MPCGCLVVSDSVCFFLIASLPACPSACLLACLPACLLARLPACLHTRNQCICYIYIYIYIRIFCLNPTTGFETFLVKWLTIRRMIEHEYGAHSLPVLYLSFTMWLGRLSRCTISKQNITMSQNTMQNLTRP